MNEDVQNLYRLSLPLPPSANDNWTVVRGRMVKTKVAKEYQALAGWVAKEQGLREPLVGEVVLSVWVYRKAKRGDLDNYFKVLLDALQGIAYANDSQIVELHAYRREDDDKQGYVIVEIAC